MTLNHAPDLWLANHSVTRWHTNATLARIGQTNADHSAGMCALALVLWPDTGRDLLRACLLHDAAESVVGDIPGPGKRADLDLSIAYGIAQDRVLKANGWTYVLTDADAAKLTLLDRLEAYRFVRLHAPHQLAQDDWRETYAWLRQAAPKLNADIDWMLA